MRGDGQWPGDGRDAREAAFVALYEEHYADVLAFLRRRTDDEAARDVAAETFTIAWRRLDVAVDRGLPWLYRTARLVLANWHRGQRRGRAAVTRIESLREAEDHDGTSAGFPEEHADRSLLLDAVGQLSPMDRELLLLTVWEELDVPSAAAVVGCTANAAHVRLHRARRRLRALLSEGSFLPEAR